MSDLREIQRSVCKQIGIQDSVTKIWLDRSRPSTPKAEADVYRIDFDGPVVGTDMHAFYKYQEGLVSPGMLRRELKKADGADVEIVINSPGGSAYDGIAMYGELLKYKGKVNIVVSGMCFSAATFFLCLPDTHRTAMAGSEIMIHNAWTIAMGDYREMEKTAKLLHRLDATIATNYAKRSVHGKKVLMQLMDDETWMTPEEALDGGFIDEIYDGLVDEGEDEAEAEGALEDDEPEASAKPKSVSDAEAAALEVLRVCYNQAVPQPAATNGTEG